MTSSTIKRTSKTSFKRCINEDLLFSGMDIAYYNYHSLYRIYVRFRNICNLLKKYATCGCLVKNSKMKGEFKVGRKTKEAGNLIPYEDVKNKLDKDFYGTVDLLSMEFFRSRWEIESAIKRGELVQNCVNESTIFFKKENVLEYWRSYRDVQLEEVKINISKKQVEILNDLILRAQRYAGTNIDKSDIIINLLKCLDENRDDMILCVNVKKIFTKADRND